MTLTILLRLLALVATVALGYLAARRRWLGRPEDGDAGRVLGNAAFFLFVPALLFRTTVRLDLMHMPWRTVAAFFLPMMAVMLLVYLWQRRRLRAAPAQEAGAAADPAVHAITAVFGNSVQVGIPFVSALLGEAGLAIHIALVSLHALVLLTLLTTLVELDLARERARGQAAVPLARTLATTARNTLIHPVVLPVLAGLLWNLGGLGLNTVVDETLATLASAVVPVCLVLIGVTLSTYGLQGRVRGALVDTALKMLVLPAIVLAVAFGLFGLRGTPLAVVVMLAAMPVGSNALIFAQRYQRRQAETTAAIVLSTLAFAPAVWLWLSVLQWLGP